MYNIYSAAGLLADGLAQSPSEAVPLDLLWQGLGVLLANGQSVALWEEGVQNSFCLFTGTPCDGVFSSDLVGVSNCLLRASNCAFLAVSDSSELLLVTSLAFSDLALAHLGGSGVEVLLICALHWSLFAAKLLVTALPCCSLTA